MTYPTDTGALDKQRNALRAEAAAALCVQAEETLTMPVPLRLAVKAAPEAAAALVEALKSVTKVHGICGNCGQWQRSKGRTGLETTVSYDCVHDCRARGFEPAPLTPAQRAGALKQAQYCGRMARGGMAPDSVRAFDSIYQWARDAAHYARKVAK